MLYKSWASDAFTFELAILSRFTRIDKCLFYLHTCIHLSLFKTNTKDRFNVLLN